MTPRDLIQAACDAEPEIMEKTAQVIEVLDRNDPASASEIVQDIREITNVAQEKTAATDMKRFGLALGGSLLAGVGTALATDLYDAARRGLTKSRNYKRMIEANKDLTQDDPGKVRQNFDMLHRYAPDFTADPILAGGLVGYMSKLPGNEMNVIRDAIQARKNLAEAKGSQFRPGGAAFSLHKEPDALELATVHAGNQRELEKLKSQLRESSNLSAEQRARVQAHVDRMQGEADRAHEEARDVNARIDDRLGKKVGPQSQMDIAQRWAMHDASHSASPKKPNKRP